MFEPTCLLAPSPSPCRIKTLTEWFHDNCMIINPGNCTYICLCKKNNNDDTISFNKFNLENSNKETILGKKITKK